MKITLPRPCAACGKPTPFLRVDYYGNEYYVCSARCLWQKDGEFREQRREAQACAEEMRR